MARTKNAFPSKRFEIRPSPGVVQYLHDVVRLQTMGKTPQEVVERFVGERIEQLIQSGTIKRKSWSRASKRGSRRGK